jgi:HPt (histidine-containing phosphotransfer) domain-containing protein
MIVYQGDEMAEGIVYVDMADGLKRVMNNVRLYVKLVGKFKTDMSVTLQDLVAAAGAQDWEKAQAAAHTIKGTSANLSLVELNKQALEVETQIKGKSVNPESLENLKTCFNETILSIDKVIAENA